MENKKKQNTSTHLQVVSVVFSCFWLLCFVCWSETPVVRCQTSRRFRRPFLPIFSLSCKSPSLIVVVHTVITSVQRAAEVRSGLARLIPATSWCHISHRSVGQTHAWLIPLPSNSWNSSRGLIHHNTEHCNVITKGFHSKQQKIPLLFTCTGVKGERDSREVRVKLPFLHYKHNTAMTDYTLITCNLHN